MNATNAASKRDQLFQERGVVLDVSARALMVETAAGRFEARRAVSCLIAPAAGDVVLLAVPASGPLYVLAVLERSSETPLALVLDGDAEVACSGQLSLFAPERLELRSGGEVATTARVASTTAVHTAIHTERLSFVGRLVEAHTHQIKGVLGMVDTVLDRLSQRVKSSYRWVEGIDMTRAGDVDMRARTTLSFRGKSAFVSADELVKMHGEQIHLG